MKNIVILAAALALAACDGGPANEEKEQAFAAARALPLCDSANAERDVKHRFDGVECKLDLGAGRIAHVKPTPLPEDHEGTGRVDLTLFNADGGIVQSLSEPEVTSYIPVTAAVEDFDRDGAGDIWVTVHSGNVNTTSAIWGARGDSFVRLGQIYAVSTSRTGDGYIALETRGSAATYGVEFVRVDAGAIMPIANFILSPVDDGKGGVAKTECELGEAPGIAALNLTPEAATAKFCAEPSAQIE